VPPELRPAVRVGAVATPAAAVVTSGPGEPVVELLRRLAQRRQGAALVVGEDGRLVGVVSADDLARAGSTARAGASLPDPGPEPVGR
jgi:CBS domain-containing protein